MDLELTPLQRRRRLEADLAAWRRRAAHATEPGQRAAARAQVAWYERQLAALMEESQRPRRLKLGGDAGRGRLED